MGPVEVVQQQVNAYLKRNIDGFLACYAPDAVIRDGDGNVLMSGHAEMRDQYAPFFNANPDLSVDISSRMRIQSWVVDCEHIRYAAESVYAIVGYRVHDGVIQTVVMMGDN